MQELIQIYLFGELLTTFETLAMLVIPTLIGLCVGWLLAYKVIYKNLVSFFDDE